MRTPEFPRIEDVFGLAENSVSPRMSPLKANRSGHVNMDQIAVEDLGKRISRVTVRFGFAEQPALPPMLPAHAERLSIVTEDTSFFLGRETPVPTTRPHLALRREKLFIVMTRNAVSASDYFQIPPRRVVELGTKVEL